MLRKNEKYFVLFGAFLIELAANSYYITATTKHNIEDYMNRNNSSSPPLSIERTIWISNSIVIGMGVTLSFGGYLDSKIGSLNTILFGGWLLSINICLMALTLNTYLSVIIITYGFIGGCGSGIAYGVALGLPLKWFQKNKGLILGITISGYGLSTTIFDIVKELILYPHGTLQIDKLPIFFLILGLSFASIQGVAIFIISRPLFKQFKQKIDSKSIINSNDDLSIISVYNEIRPHQIIFEYDFWILWLIMFLNNSCDTLIASLFYEYTKQHTYNRIFGQITILSMTGAIFNSFGRLILGHLVEKFSFKKVMLSMTLFNMLFIGTIPVIVHFACKSIVFIFWFGITNFLNGGNFSVFPTMFVKLFGNDNFVFNYGMLYTSTSVSTTVMCIIIVYNQNRLSIFIAGAVISFIAAILTLLFRGKSLIIYNS